MRPIFSILLLVLTLQTCAQNNNKEKHDEAPNVERIMKDYKFGFINNQGDTIIPIGKYKFLNPIDDHGMILAMNHDDKQGYIDINKKVLIPFIYDDLGVFAYHLAFAKKDGNFGYIDREGKVIIDFQFSQRSYFYQPGIAVINKNTKYGIIDTLENYLLDCAYDYIDYDRKNEIAVVRKDKKWGFYFLHEDRLSDFEFDRIYGSTNIIPVKRTYNRIKEIYFNRNRVLVKKDSKFAVLNSKLEEVVKYGTYENMEPMNYYGYSIVSQGNQYGIVDSLGLLKVPIAYDLISTKPSRSYGNDFTTFLVKRNDKYQILNKNAELEIKQKFDRVEILEGNYYLAHANDSIFLIDDQSKIIADEYTEYSDFSKGFLVRSDDKMGAIDYEGNIIIPFVYDSLSHPHLNKRLFACQKEKYGVIDFEGNILIPFEYEQIGLPSYSNYKDHHDNLIVQKDKKLGTINMKNEIIIPIIYDGICSWIEYSPDEHYVKKDGFYGMVKPNGEIMIPCIYDQIYYEADQTIKVVKNGKYGILNRDNETIVPCEYDKIIVDIGYWEFEENHVDKLVLFKDGVWQYADLAGNLLAKNIDERTILEEYPYAKSKGNFSFDALLILVR